MTSKIIFIAGFSLIFLAVPYFMAGWISSIDWVQYFVAVGGVSFALYLSGKA